MKQFIPALALVWLASAFGEGQPKPTEEWVRADVVRISTERARITLKHQAIPSVKMDAMTMRFRVSDPATLSTVKPGDRVRFSFRNEGGEIVVIDLQPEP